MKTLTTLVLVVIMFVGGAALAQQERPLHEIHTMMVFNFTKYVQWPDQDKAGEFVIAVIGNDEVYKTLTTWYSGKAKGAKTYVIKKFNNAADVSDCSVVYIDKSKSGEFDAVNAKVKGKGTLVVTDRNGLGARGSCINFKTVEDKLKIELNQKAMETANLKVSSSLTTMAILI
jgi:YfiR/HmsC-like